MLRTAITVKKAAEEKQQDDRIMRSDHDDDNKQQAAESSSSSSVQTGFLPTVVAVAFLAFVLYHVAAMAYVIHSLTTAAKGPFGLTLAVNDALSEQFPMHTILLQKMVLLPIPNPGAKRYYESQRDFFLQAARDFELHPYWSTYNQATPDMNFRQVVTERIRSMYRQFKETHRMDYRLEKDRCAQFDFLRRNQIPHPMIRKTWYSQEQVLQDVESGAAVENLEHWPVFFKACHLTQRSSLGTFAVPSKQAFPKTKQDIMTWIKDKWDYRSRDVDRPWQAEGDALTDELTPAILVQDPMWETTETPAHTHLSKNASSPFTLGGRIALGLVEVKAEVFWGKVYLMQIDGTTVFLRNGDIEDYTTFTGGVLHRPSKTASNNNPRTAWIRDEGHLDCVIEIAERTAQAAHIDYIRVDVFLDRGNPRNCAVNEVSLSSGYSYFGHEMYMAKMWAEPLDRKLYQRFNSTTPVYELVSPSVKATA